MEKKAGRAVQGASSRALAADAPKKIQDASGCKQWPRGCRRREPVGGSLSALVAAKPEPSRKPAPQRNRSTVDKRPRPRGGSFAAGKEEAGLTGTECAELGSVFVQGSKKQSLNHLLNFHYAPRERARGEKVGHRCPKSKFNKEQFLQANCQFVVNSCGDYKQYVNNPDALVNWDFIEQVNVQMLEYPSCPICLYPPVAAKMTRCGHIYCWSCILHYLALSDKSSRKCPICYESVHKQDLKTVVPFLHPPLNVNDTITFRLMKRLHGSLMAYPIDYDVPSESNVLYNMSQMDCSNIYSKLIIADRSDVMAIIERERKELEVQLKEGDNDPERCFIEQAITLLTDRESFVLRNEVENAVGALTECTESTHRCDYLQPLKYHYFYQASDGQHIYLHAINVKMLEHTYGSLENCPRTLEGRIIEKEGGSMTEDLRKRLRCLQHLPLTCQFEVAEILLKSPVVSEETLEHFKDQLEMRRKKRQRKARDEKRREKRITEEENKKIMGQYPSANIHIESHRHFPEFSPDIIPNHQRTESESTPRSLSPVSTSSSQTNVGSFCESGLSFAKMLTTSKPKPDISHQQKVTPEVVRMVSVTGSRATSSFVVKHHVDSDGDCEEGHAPAFNQSFGDAIAMALEKAALADDCEVEQGAGKKKKKKKQKVLFATSMIYSGN